jgi:hypothetical protein
MKKVLASFGLALLAAVLAACGLERFRNRRWRYRRDDRCGDWVQ